MSWTPGPWRLHLYGTGGFDVLVDEGVICMRHAWARKKVESEANAFLIAAAPELLEVLEETLEAATVMANIIVSNRLTKELDKYPQLTGFGKRANAAIAKAKGE